MQYLQSINFQLKQVQKYHRNIPAGIELYPFVYIMINIQKCLSALGYGYGSSVVVKDAFERRTHKQVAVKMIRKEKRPRNNSEPDYLMKEMDIPKNLDHPCIVLLKYWKSKVKNNLWWSWRQEWNCLIMCLHNDSFCLYDKIPCLQGITNETNVWWIRPAVGRPMSASVYKGSRKLHLKFGQNRTSNSWDIADILLIWTNVARTNNFFVGKTFLFWQKKICEILFVKFFFGNNLFLSKQNFIAIFFGKTFFFQ